MPASDGFEPPALGGGQRQKVAPNALPGNAPPAGDSPYKANRLNMRTFSMYFSKKKRWMSSMFNSRPWM